MGQAPAGRSTTWRDQTRGARRLLRALAGSLEDKELRADVRKCESASGVAGVLNLAAALEPFAAAVADLDADPSPAQRRQRHPRPAHPRICVPLPRRPHHEGMPWCLPTPALRPRSGRASWPVCCPTSRVRRFLQRLVGLALLGAVRRARAGDHSRESELTESRCSTRPSVSCWATTRSLRTRSVHAPRGRTPDRGNGPARGALGVGVESDEPRRLAEATVKRLTGGDTIRARRMRQDWSSSSRRTRRCSSPTTCRRCPATIRPSGDGSCHPVRRGDSRSRAGEEIRCPAATRSRRHPRRGRSPDTATT